MNMFATFQLHRHTGFCGDDFLNSFFAFLAFRLLWQPIGLDKICMFCRGLHKEHFCKTLSKISAMKWQ